MIDKFLGVQVNIKEKIQIRMKTFLVELGSKEELSTRQMYLIYKYI